MLGRYRSVELILMICKLFFSLQVDNTMVQEQNSNQPKH